MQLYPKLLSAWIAPDIFSQSEGLRLQDAAAKVRHTLIVWQHEDFIQVTLSAYLSDIPGLNNSRAANTRMCLRKSDQCLKLADSDAVDRSTCCVPNSQLPVAGHQRLLCLQMTVIRMMALAASPPDIVSRLMPMFSTNAKSVRHKRLHVCNQVSSSNVFCDGEPRILMPGVMDILSML